MKRGPLSIALSFKDMSARSEFAEVLRELPWVELAEITSGAMFDLVIHEATDPDLEDLDAPLALTSSGGEVFLASTAPDPEMLIKAMRMGVHEFIPVPCRPEELLEALDRLRKRVQASDARSESDRGRIITVAGGKAGIGTTTLAVNLAHEINAAAPGSTALMDLRRPEGEIPLFLDMEYTYTWGDVVENLVRLDQTYLAGVLARHDSGLAVLPAPDQDENSGNDLTANAVRDILFELAAGYDNVVVDMKAGLDEVSLRVLSVSDEIRLAMVLSLPCLARVKRFLETVRSLDPEMESRIQLVVNRHVSGSGIDVAEAQQILDHPVNVFVPEDPKTTLSALNQGKLLAEFAPASPVRKSIADMAAPFIAENDDDDGTSKSGLFSFFRRSGKQKKQANQKAGKADAASAPAGTGFAFEG